MVSRKEPIELDSWSNVNLRVDSDGRNQDLAAALHDVGAGEDHRVLVDTLVDLVGLAGQTAFINLKMERR